MELFTAILISLAFTIIAELIRPKQNPPNAKAASLGDFNVPTATEDRVIPVFWGRVLMKGPNCTWYGDLHSSPLKKRVKTGLFSSKNQTYAYKYYLGLELVFAQCKADEIVGMRFGDNKVSFTAGTSGTNVLIDNGDHWYINLDQPNLFGGSDYGSQGGGGVGGVMRIYKGLTSGHTHNAYLESKIGTTLSPLNTLLRVVQEGMYLGTQTSIATFALEAARYPNGLGLTGGKERIGDDANPACIIYEILTDPRWSVGDTGDNGGVQLSDVDVASLQALGNTLYSENIGLSFIQDQAATALDVINTVLQHIDAVAFTDPTTGLITFEAVRGGYDTTSLPVYDESVYESIKFTRGSWSETFNTLKVNYTDRSQDYTSRTVQARDLANVQGQGGLVAVQTADKMAFNTSTAATWYANRAIRSLAYPVSKVDLVLNRTVWGIRLGSVFKLTSEALGLSEVIYRVIRVDYSAVDQNQITVSAVEDVFALKASSYYVPPSGGGWVAPTTDPQPLAYQALFELPYALAGEQARYVATLGAPASGIDSGYQLWEDRAGGTNYVQQGSTSDFTPVGTLTADYLAGTAAYDTIGFTVSGGVLLDQLASLSSDDELYSGANILRIKSTAGEELMAWKTIVDNGDGTYTIKNIVRGIFDTFPLDHAAGDLVWFITDGYSLLDETPFSTNATVTAKLPTFNIKGVLPLASASQTSLTLTGRALYPYPVANLQANGLTSPAFTYGDVSVTWLERNRLTQTTVLRQDSASVSSEGPVDVKLYVGGTLKHTYAAPQTSPLAYTAAQRAADSTDGTQTVTVVVTVTSNGYAKSRTLGPWTMTGLGMTLGRYLGGLQQ